MELNRPEILILEKVVKAIVWPAEAFNLWQIKKSLVSKNCTSMRKLGNLCTDLNVAQPFNIHFQRWHRRQGNEEHFPNGQMTGQKGTVNKKLPSRDQH